MRGFQADQQRSPEKCQSLRQAAHCRDRHRHSATLIGGVCAFWRADRAISKIAPPEIQVQTHYTGRGRAHDEQAFAAPRTADERPSTT